MGKKSGTTIQFSLREDSVVTNSTVKLSVMVSVFLSDGVTNDNLSETIRSALSKFVSAGEWVFSNPTRATTLGIERATYQAYNRVPAEENYNLDERLRAVNVKGLEITNLQVDTSTPEWMLRDAESELRVKLLKAIAIEQEKLEEALDGHLFTESVEFADSDNAYGNSKSLRAGTYAAPSVAPPGGAIGNTERVSLTANVKLRTKG